MEMYKLDSVILKFRNFHLIHFIVEKLDLFNFHPIFFYYYHHNFTHIHQKWKYCREEQEKK